MRTLRGESGRGAHISPGQAVQGGSTGRAPRPQRQAQPESRSDLPVFPVPLVARCRAVGAGAGAAADRSETSDFTGKGAGVPGQAQTTSIIARPAGDLLRLARFLFIMRLGDSFRRWERTEHMTQQSIEDRLAIIESKIVELEAERARLRSLSTLQVRQTELREMFDGLQEYVGDRLQTFEEHVTLRLDLAEDTNTARFQEIKAGQQALQAGQEQILAILTGKPKTND